MRSVVLNSTARCPRCALPLRWCICGAEQAVALPFRLDLLTHRRELHRPSSTGNLITRLCPAAQRQVWSPDQPPQAEQVVDTQRETWVLHPNGEDVPVEVPAALQVVLLDGSWSEAAGIARGVTSWGRLVRLPLSGDSRFWLRAKHADARYSTVEALLHLLQHLGAAQAQHLLRLQFELHVYAHLRARGNVEQAVQFLEASPVPSELPDFLAALTARRPQPTG